MPPPFASWAEALITQGHVLCVSFRLWAKNRTKLIEDPFFYALHLILGKKSD